MSEEVNRIQDPGRLGGCRNDGSTALLYEILYQVKKKL